MQGFNLPYEPIPQKLYALEDLFAGFDAAQPTSWVETLDFRIYRHFIAEGRTAPRNPYMGMMQALHDNAIMEATSAYVDGQKVVAVVGDHELSRDSVPYRDAVSVARRLTQNGFLICTGGGPGAMEAGHLGAGLAKSSEAEVQAALGRLADQPVVPALAKIVDSAGQIDYTLVAAAWAWFKPAFELANSMQAPGESLAIPTWGYGHEPPTPFATHIAKYFQNSVREDGLLAIAQYGVICFPGRAGTIQEIFQDAAQNYYRSFGRFSPMILFGAEYWTTTYPVIGLLKNLFGAQFAKYVMVTDSVEAAAQFIEQFPG